jgi:hypothetical protein
LFGDPDIFISTSVKYPNETCSTWKSFRYGSDVVLVNPSTDVKACIMCTYYISVLGASESSYTITVSLDSSIPQLVDGVPIQDHVSTFGVNQYIFSNSFGDSKDIKVLLSSSSGNADLYVTLDGTKPNILNYAYHSNNIFSSDLVNILHSDTEYQSHCINSSDVSRSYCLVRLAVIGLPIADYSITLTTSFSATVLQLGITQRGTVASGRDSMYRLLFSPVSINPFVLRFVVSPTSGHLSMYLSCFENNPNVRNAMWVKAPVELGGSVINIESLSLLDRGCFQSSNIFCSIHGDTSAAYSIGVSVLNDTAMQVLVPELASVGEIGQHLFEYYYIKLPSSSTLKFRDIRFHLSALQGDVDIYISSSWATRPVYSSTSEMVSSYLFSSTHVGNEELVIDHDSLEDICTGVSTCYLVVGVFGTHILIHGNSKFSLLVDYLDSTVTLSNGIPRRGSVAKGRLEFYKFSLTQEKLDLVFSITQFSGDPGYFPRKFEFSPFILMNL